MMRTSQLRAAESRGRTGPRGLTLIELLVCLAIIGIIVVMFMPFRRTAGEAARRAQCKNHLRQIGLALFNYDAEYGSLPPAYTVDEDGRPLHSWRTLLLPFLDEQHVYDRIDLSKPWDDPANQDAAAGVLNAFSCPSADMPRTHTLYHAIVSPNSWIRAGSSPSVLDPAASIETTIVTEVDLSRATHWMEPVDVDETFLTQLDESLETAHAGGVQALLADGTVRFIGLRSEAGEREKLLLRETEPDVASASQ